MLRKTAALLFSLSMLASALPAGAAVVFSNLDSGYDPLFGYTVGSPALLPDFDAAMAFVPTGEYRLDSIWLGMTFSTGQNEVAISFAVDAAGRPGTILETINLIGVLPSLSDPPAPQPPVIATSALRPLMTSGAQYWIVASAPVAGTLITWNDNTTGDFGPTAFRQNEGPWTTADPGLRGAMRINGTPVAAIPEPSTYALMLAGLGLVAFAAKRRRKAYTAASPGRSTGC